MIENCYKLENNNICGDLKYIPNINCISLYIDVIQISNFFTSFQKCIKKNWFVSYTYMYT